MAGHWKSLRGGESSLGTPLHLYQAHRRVVYARALALLGTKDLAEDATHDIFLRVLGHAAEVAQHPTPVAWLRRVTTNHCLNWMRDEARRSDLLEGPAQLVCHAPCAEGRIVARDVLERIPHALQELAVYYYFDDLTRDEIAGILRLSRRTVGTRLLTLRAVVDSIAGTPGVTSQK
jgi:RNA polymerase sigma-70 factor (ECF subfamily)